MKKLVNHFMKQKIVLKQNYKGIENAQEIQERERKFILNY